MTHTKTYTLTVEEKTILAAIEEARLDEVSANTIRSRLREGEVTSDHHPLFDDELMFTVLGQLIERGLVLRIEHEPGKFCYRRA